MKYLDHQVAYAQGLLDASEAQRISRDVRLLDGMVVMGDYDCTRTSTMRHLLAEISIGDRINTSVAVRAIGNSWSQVRIFITAERAKAIEDKLDAVGNGPGWARRRLAVLNEIYPLLDGEVDPYREDVRQRRPSQSTIRKRAIAKRGKWHEGRAS